MRLHLIHLGLLNAILLACTLTSHADPEAAIKVSTELQEKLKFFPEYSSSITGFDFTKEIDLKEMIKQASNGSKKYQTITSILVMDRLLQGKQNADEEVIGRIHQSMSENSKNENWLDTTPEERGTLEKGSRQPSAAHVPLHFSH